MAAEEDLKEAFTGAFRQLLDAHIINDGQVGLEMAREELAVTAQRVIVQEVADRIKDGTGRTRI